MTNCSGLHGVMNALSSSFGWRCKPALDSNVVEISTGRFHVDGEPVTLLVTERPDGALVASDGGDSWRRLVESGYSPHSKALNDLWAILVRWYRLEASDSNRIFVTVPDWSEAPYELSRLADALVAVDALDMLGLPPQEPTARLADDVEAWLRGQSDLVTAVEHKPRIDLPRLNERVIPSLRVSTLERPSLLVQVATSGKNQPFEHAYALFGQVRKAGLPHEGSLTLLGGSLDEWSPTKIRMLGDVSIVGFWDYRHLVTGFLEGQTPDDAVLLPDGQTIPIDV